MTLLAHFILPLAPTAKGRARTRIVHTKAGKAIASHYTPAATRAFEGDVAMLAKAALRGREPYTCPVDLLVEFRFPIPASWPKWKADLARRGWVHHTQVPDCSNLVKAVEDACNGVLWRDDGQVVGSVQDKVWTPDGQAAIVVHLFRRAGLPSYCTRADADAYPKLDTVDAMPVGRRLRRDRLVTP